MEHRGRQAVRRRYDRIARFYDLYQEPMEAFAAKRWRRMLFERLHGDCIIEAGVGTGGNLPFYPAGKELVAFDVSEKMLARSSRRRSPATVHRVVMDVEALGFADATFDSAVATFLFCSVDNPVAGLCELRRAVRPGGQVLLLEHVRPGNPLLGRLFDWLTPVSRAVFGPELNRDTVTNVRRAGLVIEDEKNLSGDIVKLLVCRVESGATEHAPR